MALGCGFLRMKKNNTKNKNGNKPITCKQYNGVEMQTICDWLACK